MMSVAALEGIEMVRFGTLPALSFPTCRIVPNGADFTTRAGKLMRGCLPLARHLKLCVGIETGRVRLRLLAYLRATDRTRLDLFALMEGGILSAGA